MTKYVDLDKLVNRLDEHYTTLGKKYGFDDMYVRGYGEAISNMEDEPVADVQEVKHGHWDEIRGAYGKLEGWIHRGCGRMSMAKDNYCPKCGARMDLEENE